MKEFWLCFVPLFVAVDAVGVLPIFMSLCREIPAARRRMVIVQSVVTAMIVAVAFLIIGRDVLRLLRISVADFMVAGGILLFAISLTDLLTAEKLRKTIDVETVGAVPIGVPLITGPAVLTTCVLLVDQHGMNPAILAAVVNILIAGVIFWFATPIGRFLGHAGSRTLSKIASLLLAAIAVMMVRKGIVAIFAEVAR